MKFDKYRSSVFLSLLFGFLLGTTALIQAQDQRDDTKPAPDNRQEAARPSPQDETSSKEARPSRQNEDSAARQNNDNDKDARANEGKSSRNEDRSTRQEGQEVREQNGIQEDSRSQVKRGGQSGEAEQAQGTGGRRGGHIPDDRFRANFGHGHTFKMQRPTVVQGQPTFQYGGYSFALVDAWPVGWAYTDDCYIDYVDGEYFLFDLAHPGIRLAVFVVM